MESVQEAETGFAGQPDGTVPSVMTTFEEVELTLLLAPFTPVPAVAVALAVGLTVAALACCFAAFSPAFRMPESAEVFFGQATDVYRPKKKS